MSIPKMKKQHRSNSDISSTDEAPPQRSNIPRPISSVSHNVRPSTSKTLNSDIPVISQMPMIKGLCMLCTIIIIMFFYILTFFK